MGWSSADCAGSLPRDIRVICEGNLVDKIVVVGEIISLRCDLQQTTVKRVLGSGSHNVESVRQYSSDDSGRFRREVSKVRLIRIHLWVISWPHFIRIFRAELTEDPAEQTDFNAEPREVLNIIDVDWEYST